MPNFQMNILSPYTEGLNWVQVDAEDCSPPQDGAAGLSETSELIQPRK
jgi:hypothetical protein